MFRLSNWLPKLLRSIKRSSHDLPMEGSDEGNVGAPQQTIVETSVVTISLPGWR